MRSSVVCFWLLLGSGALSQEALRGDDRDKALQTALAAAEKKYVEAKEEWDMLWMMALFREMERSKFKRATTPVEEARIEEIYKTSTGNAKLYAFTMMPLYQDVSRWIKEAEVLFRSDEKNHAAAAVVAIESRLKEGSEREKVMLSNSEALLASLKSFPERFPKDQISLERIKNIESLVIPFKAKRSPQVSQPQCRKPRKMDRSGADFSPNCYFESGAGMLRGARFARGSDLGKLEELF